MRIRTETLINLAMMQELASEFTVRDFADRSLCHGHTSRNRVKRYLAAGLLALQYAHHRTSYYSLTQLALDLLAAREGTFTLPQEQHRVRVNSVFALGDAAVKMPSQRDWLAALGPCGK